MALLLRFWYVPLLAVLLGVVVWMRGDLIAAHGQLDKANAQVTSLTDANKSLNTALGKVQAQRIDNDAIAAAVAAKLQGNTVRETNTRTIIEKAAANDPVVRNWYDEPIPDSVRGALRSR